MVLRIGLHHYLQQRAHFTMMVSISQYVKIIVSGRFSQTWSHTVYTYFQWRGAEHYEVPNLKYSTCTSVLNSMAIMNVFVDPAVFRRSHRFSRLPLGVRWKWLKTWTFHSWVPFHLIPELVCCTFMHIPTSNVQLLYQYSNAVSKGYVIVITHLAGLTCFNVRTRTMQNGRGDVMHEPKASALRHRDRYCIVRVRSLQHVSPANCLTTVLLLI